MSLSDLPRGYDAWKLSGPDERDPESDLEDELARGDREYDEARDQEDRDKDDAMREDAADLRRELARQDRRGGKDER